MSLVDTPPYENPIEPRIIKIAKPISIYMVSSITVLVLLLLWWLVTSLGLIDPLFLPSPVEVINRLYETSTQGYMGVTLWQHISASIGRIGLALLAAILAAVPIGIAIGRSRLIRGILDPIIEFYRPIPPLAYLPLIVIWFGIGETSKVLLIFLAIFAPIVISTATGVASVDPAKLRAAQSLGATNLQLIRYVIVPSALPHILTGIRIGLGVGWSTLVAAELVAATEGIGFMVQSAAQLLATDVVIAGIFVIAIIAVLLEFGLRRLQQYLVPWEKQIH